MMETKIKKRDYLSSRLGKKAWKKRQRNHRQIIDDIVAPYLRKKQRQHKDPVLDFLFEYYAFRPSHLKRWSPGVGVMLQQATPQAIPEINELTFTKEGAFLSPSRFPENRKDAARWILKLLQNSLLKAPSFGCFGMHEWAMVYKSNKPRHEFPLRLDAQDLATFVESRPLVCTHFDAFRFFTKPAKPLNKHDLSRQNFAQNEQAGCLHTNMDLYKWAFKLFPWISSNIIRKAFFLALDTRVIDMKASPYDLGKRGLEPIKIETEGGKLEYVKCQKEIYRRSLPVRKALIGEYEQLISHF